MFEVVKKSVYMGLGLASLTTDKVRKLAGELSREAKLSEEEGHRLAEELERRAGESRKELEVKIDEHIDQALVQVGLLRAGVKKAVDRTTEGLQGLVDRRVDAALEKLGVARKEEVEAVLQRLVLLEQKLHQSPAEASVVGGDV